MVLDLNAPMHGALPEPPPLYTYRDFENCAGVAFDDPTWRWVPAIIRKDEEWNEKHDELCERLQAAFAERVYIALCVCVGPENYWRLDDREWFNEILCTAVDDDAWEIYRTRHRYRNEDMERWFVFDLQEDFFSALDAIVESGRVEWVIRNGWPWLHIPDAAAVASKYHVDRDRFLARQQRVEELRSMPYREYLQTPEWKRRRQEHLNAAGERCQVCNRGPGKGTSLHVHHRTYANRGNERFNDLIVLCGGCHQYFHEGRRVAR